MGTGPGTLGPADRPGLTRKGVTRSWCQREPRLNRTVKRFIKRIVDGRRFEQLNRRVQPLLGAVGRLLMKVLPRQVERLEAGDFTIYLGKKNPIDYLLRAGMAQKALGDRDYQSIQNYHTRFWSSHAAYRYHEGHRSAHEDVTLLNFSSVLDNLETALAERPEIRGLCEIGCGSGDFLQHLAERFGQLERLVGLDLSPESTEANRQRNRDPRVEFVTADADRWIRDNGESHRLYVSHRGVFEYFPQASLEALLMHLATERRPNLLLAVEPVGIDFDLEKEVDSRTYGREFSFSHNYPELLGRAGFQMLCSEEVSFFDHRLMALLAESRAA